MPEGLKLRLVEVRVVRNVEGEIVVTLESPVMRTTAYLSEEEGHQLALLLLGALRRGERG